MKTSHRSAISLRIVAPGNLFTVATGPETAGSCSSWVS